LGLACFHLDQLTCFSNTEFITDSTHFHVPTLVPLISKHIIAQAEPASQNRLDRRKDWVSRSQDMCAEGYA
jgi:hypothetical protein